MTLPDPVEPPAGAPRRDAADAFVSLSGITKSFGPTLANTEIDLDVGAGEILGLVGGNGAGKSTLMRILCGVMPPTLGEVAFAGAPVDLSRYDASEAQRRGIRMVHQELSLCTNLSVAENFFLEAPGAARPRPGWRRAYRERARAALDEVFPGARIDVGTPVGRLPIGERQMVEIARAAATPGVRLIILDEPTSSLGLERSRQLRAFMHRKAAEGLAFIFISHKLQEVVDIATGVAVLRNGRLVWRGATADASVDRLVRLMGGDRRAEAEARPPRDHAAAETMVRIGVPWTDDPITLGRGEIVGLAGLEGSGQRELLHAVFDDARGIEREAKAGFIAGDRQKEGIFPLWTVLANISLGRIAPRPGHGLVSDREEAEAARGPADRLSLDRARLGSGITELSGGNQQKALVARALVSDAPVLLLDDPTRGVDIATKQDFYRLIAEIAASGRTLVWHTTEDAELLAADRVLVFSGGRIVSELRGEAISEAAIVEASFAGAGASGGTDTTTNRSRWPELLAGLMPYLSLAVVLAVMFTANPLTATGFGLNLLLMPAVALVLVAAAQMFIVGGSEIDLGAGAFAGLVSVLAATLLYQQPLWGVLAIAAAVAAYSGLGGLIQARRIPAIVVTLGASFIWLGIGLSIQPTPGGASPEWLTAMFRWSVPGIPSAIVMILAIAALVLAIDRTPLGVVLRGFGNNASAMVLSGWSPVRYAVIRYFIAALFAGTAGLALTAINTASDINSGSSYTLLSVAAVVMGGCALIGGVISPVGAVVGAVTLSLLGALLGLLNISSDLNAATQGLLLLAILAVRSLAARSTEEA